MDIRPQDLPELRAEIRAQMVHQKHIRRLWLDAERPATRDDVDEVGHAFQSLIDEAELFHVAASMTELVRAASSSLEVFTPLPEDAPNETGFLVFNGDTGQSIRFDDGCETRIRAVIWAASREKFMVIPVAEPHGEMSLGRLVAYPDMHWMANFGEELENAEIENTSIQDLRILSLLLTTWLLMQQPLAEVSEVEPDRAVRKRLRRLNQEPAAVRVIELRRPKHSGSEPGESSREYHHRWITRGHWRQQWYATRQVHRPVWIAPHVKGPEGAPMIGGEKVYAWKR